ncbi:hypothetical protein K470DRAFT_147317 [Piedraia hortae CBS 480.64]|uniref:Uncharacterized protein n=1 Tax=Piedraia hortae CBS 480.64 TaxID=1314780 RepID=A0A6A7BS43_9PEZI|nr:hypothetical protein K470DRAFT_147317 [Piedraia hortae CBS 480.64]
MILLRYGYNGTGGTSSLAVFSPCPLFYHPHLCSQTRPLLHLQSSAQSLRRLVSISPNCLSHHLSPPFQPLPLLHRLGLPSLPRFRFFFESAFPQSIILPIAVQIRVKFRFPLHLVVPEICRIQGVRMLGQIDKPEKVPKAQQANILQNQKDGSGTTQEHACRKQ